MAKKSVPKQLLDEFSWKPSGKVSKEMIDGLKPKLPKLKFPKLKR